MAVGGDETRRGGKDHREGGLDLVSLASPFAIFGILRKRVILRRVTRVRWQFQRPNFSRCNSEILVNNQHILYKDAP